MVSNWPLQLPKLESTSNLPIVLTAKQLLESETVSGVDDSDRQYLLEYYSLVREGKTNYISTLDFALITGEELMNPPQFFKTHEPEFKSKRRHIAVQ
ncbi:hypothetical protein CY34DRAFT_808154 [Suillus luteus UH-Slu-Lm8-n1]|uniref:Uncharacterized protein n=1 Tax=Suillus luteus UH-Slu-Lm8-n1 TaxID=930992 RepID=A0A0D0AD14_9AGAM|nr:hypothetical protein CY34DRAFT_808154 [Suillus luteus UH-Slu-Lm8-n1]